MYLLNMGLSADINVLLVLTRVNARVQILWSLPFTVNIRLTTRKQYAQYMTIDMDSIIVDN